MTKKQALQTDARTRAVPLAMALIALLVHAGGLVAQDGDGVATLRGLFVAAEVEQNGWFSNDAEHLREAFRKARRAVREEDFDNFDLHGPKPAPDWESTGKAVTARFEEADGDDVSVFVFSGHGGKRGDTAPSDEQPVGEDPQDELIWFGQEKIEDDRLAEVFQKIEGRKVLVFLSCYSGGLTDGAQDLRTLEQTVVISACGEETSSHASSFPSGHVHYLFAEGLIDGLSTNGLDGHAQADQNNDETVTVLEWFTFAQERTAFFVRSLKRANRVAPEFSQEPEVYPALTEAQDFALLPYKKGELYHHAWLRKDPLSFDRRGCEDPANDGRRHHSGDAVGVPGSSDLRKAKIHTEEKPAPNPWTDYHLPLPGEELEPASRPLELEMELYEPIPEAPDAPFASWHFILDLDGARATGFPGGERPVGVFPGLGVDAWVDLIWDGVEGVFFPVLFLGPEGIGNLTPAPIPVPVALSPDRTRVAFELPLDVLEEELSALSGEPFEIDVDRIEWVAVTNYAATEADFEDPPSDFFPDRHYLPEGSCERRAGDGTALCLNDGRFLVEAEWATSQGTSGRGRAMPLTGDTGTFWFFDPANVELLVKVIDACGEPFDRFWVFAGGLTNVEVDLTVTDTLTGEVRRYANPRGTAFEPILDTAGFDTCGTGGATSAAAGSRTASTPSEASTRQAVAATVGEPALFLGDGRFRVEVAWATSQGTSGRGQAVPLTGDTGTFWFFDPANVELVVKVIDACGEPFDRFWVFAGGLTNVEVEITVTDTETGAVRTYRNPQGRAFQPILHTGAFATCG